MANYTQHETLSQVEELHPGKSDGVISDLVVEPLQFNAPGFLGCHPNHFYNSLRLVVNFGREKGHRQCSAHEEDQREPEVEGVHWRSFLAGKWMMRLVSVGIIVKIYLRSHFMLLSSCTQMKKRLLEKEMMVIFDIESSTFSHKSHKAR